MKQFVVFLCLILAIGVKAAPELKLDKFIINGTVPAAGLPSFALVTATRTGPPITTEFGGGSIISLSHILTVAELIQGFATWTVGVGSINLPGLATFPVATAVAHGSFNAVNGANNIGIITLTVTLTLSATIQPIALPQIGQNLPFDYEQGRIYGFGHQAITGGIQSQILNLSYQRVTNHTQCVAAHAPANNAQQFCTRDLSRSSNICTGDFGGGFIIPYRGVDLVVGIASRAVEPCNTLSPAIYTRVSYYREWIRTTTGV